MPSLPASAPPAAQDSGSSGQGSSGQGSSGQGSSGRGGLAWVWRALTLLTGLAAVGIALRALPRLDSGLLDRLVVGHGLRGIVLFLGLAGFGCAVGMPRQVAAFAAGYAFAPSLGLGIAGLLALAAQMIGCAADFGWARLLARDWVAARLPARLAALRARVTARPFTVTLTLRLLPVGNNLALNMLGGAAAVPAAAFLAASAVGYLPQTAVCVLLGSGTHLGRITEVTIAAVLFAASAGLGVWLWRAQDAPEDAARGVTAAS